VQVPAGITTVGEDAVRAAVNATVTSISLHEAALIVWPQADVPQKAHKREPNKRYFPIKFIRTVLLSAGSL
jgi:hypothetical protein